jgi:V8-like Glu-specific endopeptidase
VKSISVMPGRDGATLPFGAATSTDFNSVDGWTNDGKGEFDYGVIVLPAPLGHDVGVFGIGVYPDDELANVEARVVGYPADKGVGTMWSDQRKILSTNPHKIFYDLDTAGGQSGAPVYRSDGDKVIAVGIHAYGVGGGVQSNSGTRITSEVYENLKRWMA